ncbi:hypothetical protein CGK32_22960 [Vibrio parahaemolyticus]|uniref:hypothetical protein n=1 Tax=Vibrio parahaemolyticus TaxID=670 RepID=UPI00111DCA16|nr:hypothetical protein [Vibrio parahaemolyticus]TOA17891.1 hypothetical protein CGK32_22960 [Vibrio parahaemolyticus]
MDKRTYNRVYQLQVGVIDYSDGGFTPFVSIESPHHMEFSSDEQVTSSGVNFNPAKVKLYNIGEDNINFLSYEGAVVVLKAGWEFDSGKILDATATDLVYVGDIVNVNTEYQGNGDVVTIVDCREGWNVSLTNKDAQVTKGMTKEQAFKYMSGIHGIPFVVNFEKMDEKIVKKDVVDLPKRLHDAMDYLCKKASVAATEQHQGVRVTWFYYNGKVYVTDRLPTAAALNGTKRKHTVGRDRIKGTPRVGRDKKVLTRGQTNPAVKTLQVTAYLQSQMSLLDVVELEKVDSDELGGGDYIITQLKHRLSYEGDYWDTTFVARGVE